MARSVMTREAESIRREEFMSRRALRNTSDPYTRRMIQERMSARVARNRRAMRRNGRET